MANGEPKHLFCDNRRARRRDQRSEDDQSTLFLAVRGDFSTFLRHHHKGIVVRLCISPALHQAVLHQVSWTCFSTVMAIISAVVYPVFAAKWRTRVYHTCLDRMILPGRRCLVKRRGCIAIRTSINGAFNHFKSGAPATSLSYLWWFKWCAIKQMFETLFTSHGMHIPGVCGRYHLVLRDLSKPVSIDLYRKRRLDYPHFPSTVRWASRVRSTVLAATVPIIPFDVRNGRNVNEHSVPDRPPQQTRSSHPWGDRCGWRLRLNIFLHRQEVCRSNVANIQCRGALRECSDRRDDHHKRKPTLFGGSFADGRLIFHRRGYRRRTATIKKYYSLHRCRDATQFGVMDPSASTLFIGWFNSALPGTPSDVPITIHLRKSVFDERTAMYPVHPIIRFENAPSTTSSTSLCVVFDIDNLHAISACWYVQPPYICSLIDFRTSG